MKKAIVGAKIYPASGAPIPEGTIIISDGKIASIHTASIRPDDCEIIEAGGKYITPGLIDAHTHVGIDEEGNGWAGEDYNETTDPITPHLRAIDGIFPTDLGFQDARRGGVTSVGIHPGSANILGGQGAALKTAGRTIEEMTLRAPVAIKAAFGENPKRVYSQQKKAPSTRMGNAGLLRQALARAENYSRKLGEKDHERDLVHEALLPLLEGELPLFAHAHRADDIMTALRISKEFGIKLVVQHGTEAHLITEVLAAEGISVVVGPSMTNRSKVELRQRTFKTPAILAEHGVEICIMTDHPVIPIQYLPVCVRLAIKEGLTFESALKAVTIAPARILGIDDRVGSIEPGKDADLVLWAAEPFTETETPETILVNGEVI